VRLNDGTSTTATVISRSPDVDIALLKIDTNRPLQTMPLGTAQDLMVGETVIAIGNAYGYEHTVSRGIVSAVKRDVRLNKEIEYRSLIQTDASINPGNSGGPLVNIHGDLVGINVAIRAGAQGIGFAIPVDTMIQMVSQMLRTQRLQLAAEGMDYRDNIQVSDDGAVRTVLVENVESHGAAAEAGLRRGDVLIRIDQVPIQCSFDVDRALLGHKAGDTVTVSYRREGQAQTASVVLEKGAVQRPNPNELVWQKLGLQVTPVNRDSVVSINSQLNGGLQVTAVLANSAAARAGIRQGDILVGLHQWETLSIDNVAFVLQHPDLSSFNPLSFYIIRSGQVRRGWIQQVD
jgi:serine protease Do